MARWRLTTAHYLSVPGIEYEIKETDTVTHRSVSKRLPVPLYLNPTDPSDHNYPGEIIVTDRPNRLHPRDIHFVGQPTQFMEPLDEEADKITEKFRKQWDNAGIDKLPTTINMTTSQIGG